MSREIVIFFFAISAVPLATFIWDIIWGLLCRHWRETMKGIEASWKRAVVVAIVMVLSLYWLHNDDINTKREVEQRNTELIRVIEQNTEVLKLLKAQLEAQNDTAKK